MNKKLLAVLIIIIFAGTLLYVLGSEKIAVGPSAPTPTPTPTTLVTHPIVGEGQHCGGNMTNAPICGSGYSCKPVPGSHLPFGDVGGTCVPQTATGTIQGQALLGPTCPVMRNPPDPKCADKPYQASFAVTSADGVSVIKQFSTDSKGMFSVVLPEGDYSIRSLTTANPYPRCSSVGPIQVTQNKVIVANIMCDTGIR